MATRRYRIIVARSDGISQPVIGVDETGNRQVLGTVRRFQSAMRGSAVAWIAYDHAGLKVPGPYDNGRHGSRAAAVKAIQDWHGIVLAGDADQAIDPFGDHDRETP